MMAVIGAFLQSRAGLAAAVALVAVMAIGALDWRHKQTISTQREAIIDLRTENLDLSTSNTNLRASIAEQNRRIEQMADDAEARVEKAQGAAVEILQRARDMEGEDATLEATPEEMNRWLDQLFP